MALITTPAFEADLFQIRSYIERDDPAAARRVLVRIQDACLSIAQMPLMGRDGDVSGTREFSIPGLPYMIVYKPQGADVVLLRALHGAREWP